MIKESRASVRENIHLEEIVGAFHVDAAGKHFETTCVDDVSVSGVGIQLSVPLEVGSNIDLTFVAGDWNISVDGKVIWCSMDTDEVKTGDSYRIGIKFNPRNTHNNVIFYMASRSMVRSAV